MNQPHNDIIAPSPINGVSVCLQDVMDEIVDQLYFTPADAFPEASSSLSNVLSRVAMLTLVRKNGTTVTGTSERAKGKFAISSDMAMAWAKSDALSKLWQELTYERIVLPAKARLAARLERMNFERDDLSTRVDALAIFLGSEGFKHVNETERKLLRQQSDVMSDYLDILNARIEIAQ